MEGVLTCFFQEFRAFFFQFGVKSWSEYTSWPKQLCSMFYATGRCGFDQITVVSLYLVCSSCYSKVLAANGDIDAIWDQNANSFGRHDVIQWRWRWCLSVVGECLKQRSSHRDFSPQQNKKSWFRWKRPPIISSFHKSISHGSVCVALIFCPH